MLDAVGYCICCYCNRCCCVCCCCRRVVSAAIGMLCRLLLQLLAECVLCRLLYLLPLCALLLQACCVGYYCSCWLNACCVGCCECAVSYAVFAVAVCVVAVGVLCRLLQAVFCECVGGGCVGQVVAVGVLCWLLQAVFCGCVGGGCVRLVVSAAVGCLMRMRRRRMRWAVGVCCRSLNKQAKRKIQLEQNIN